MLPMYKCPRCGGEVTLDEGAKELACAHCGNDILLEEQIEDEFTLDKIIAFRIDKDTAKGIP